MTEYRQFLFIIWRRPFIKIYLMGRIANGNHSVVMPTLKDMFFDRNERGNLALLVNVSKRYSLGNEIAEPVLDQIYLVRLGKSGDLVSRCLLHAGEEKPAQTVAGGREHHVTPTVEIRIDLCGCAAECRRPLGYPKETFRFSLDSCNSHVSDQLVEISP